MNPGGGAPRSEAELMLGLAEKLLAARDLIGSKCLAEQAIKSDPAITKDALQVIAVADVILSSNRRIINHVDPYAILQLDPSSSGRDPAAVRTHYTRLTRRLRPAQDRLPFADAALRLVSDAWSVLSDPSKKSLLDADLDIADGAGAPAASFPTFWTSCHSCCHVYQYDRAYLSRSLRCQTCRQAFTAAEMAAPPRIVPGTDKYYCSWVCAPLGYTGDVGGELKPFYPMRPRWASDRHGDSASTLVCKGKSAAGNQASEIHTKPPSAKMKAVAKKSTRNFKMASFGDCKAPVKRVPAVAKKTVSGNLNRAVVSTQGENQNELSSSSAVRMGANPVVIDADKEIPRSEGNGNEGASEPEDDEMGSFDIDLDDADMDATGDLLNKMADFPCSNTDGKSM